MFLMEPRPTDYDLSFRIGRVPVRVHPMFWVVSAIMGLAPGSPPDGRLLVLWIGAVFVSILIHELGHVWAMHRFGEAGRIVLYGFGGLAISDGAGRWGRRRTPREQVIISLAGPGAGFVFIGVVLGAFYAAGGRFAMEFGLPHIIGFERIDPPPNTGYYFLVMMLDLWHVNFYWGLVNLLPIYPLDGGQVSRELFSLHAPHAGILRSLVLSTMVAGLLAVVCLVQFDRRFLAFFFGILALNNYFALRQLYGGGFGGGSPW